MATTTKHTVSSVLQIVSDLRGESTLNTDAIRIRFVSRANQDFALRHYWRTHYVKDATISGTGAASYEIGTASLPIRPKGLAEVFVDGTTEDKRYSIVDFNTFKALYNQNNADRIAYEWYDATNDAWKVRINPTVASGSTITYSYFLHPATLTATTDSVICPKPKIIALLVLSDLAELEEESDKAALYRNEAEQLISELMEMEDSPAQNQLYTVRPSENQLGQAGIGTY